jgi:protein-disulfide isomerase/uncharacterized membrane protein
MLEMNMDWMRMKQPKTRKKSAASKRATKTMLHRSLGSAFLGLSTLMSLLLVAEHFGGLSLPGCGAGGACEQAANSAWGKIPLGGFEWPVSFVGLAYFMSIFVTWIVTRGGVPNIFRNLVRLGAIGSLGFCVIIIHEQMLCPYCIAIHIGNFAFWITMESTRISSSRPRFAMTSVGAIFALVTALLWIIDVQYRDTVREKAESDRSEAAQLMIDESGKRQTSSDESLFTGRYRIGPAEAPIRIVIFTDYQCQDCYNIEKQLRVLYETRQDISISIKHSPFNSDCNPYISRTMHPNACWAARAAEAAGKLWGPEGLWKMHKWLFDHRGTFETTSELETGIREMGYDPTGFAQAMSSDETLKAVRADVIEGKQLGLFFTPMIFINGVELKGWNAPNALIRTVEQVASTNPPALSAAFDQPPLARQKYIDDWREQPEIVLPEDGQEWSLGATDAEVVVVLWGDYQQAGTSKADAIIRSLAESDANVRYSYRHFPFNSDCNPNLKSRRYPNSCQAALAAEAAGRLGGNEGYWRMHAWLMANQDRFDDEALRQAATKLGFDADSFFIAMTDDDLQANIQDDIQAGSRLPRLRLGTAAGVNSIPTIFVNGRYIPRWRLDDRSVLEEIIAEAADQ